LTSSRADVDTGSKNYLTIALEKSQPAS